MERRQLLELAKGLVVPGGGDVPRRRLGRTGEAVSILGLGGAHIGTQDDPAESVRIIRTAIDGGITFLDNCWDYHDGESERRMGRALRDGYRQRVFLMTKIDGRDAKSAARQIDESLQRLGTDHLDLLQLHEVIYDADPERAFAPGGAIEALVAAQKAGKARFLGFTGHKSPAIHLQMLAAARRAGFRFDAVQMPLNVMDAHFESFEKQVLPELLADGIAVLGMKPMGDKFILESGTVEAAECLRYAASLPTSVVITGMDELSRVAQALQLARTFQPYSEPELEALLARTAEAARAGTWEKYKTTHHFDGTYERPEWLG